MVPLGAAVTAVQTSATVHLSPAEVVAALRVLAARLPHRVRLDAVKSRAGAEYVGVRDRSPAAKTALLADVQRMCADGLAA